MSKSKAYGFWPHPIYYTKKGGVKMKNEFKAGDLVFEVRGYRIVLGNLIERGESSVRLEGGTITYLTSGYALNTLYMGRLFHATHENRQALVTLYGEDAVPELPLHGSELTKKLLEKQKYVLCLASDVSDDEARSNPYLVIVESYRGSFFDEVTNNSFYEFAVPIDNNGNEITEIEK